MPPSPLTATIKRPDGRVVQTTLWQPQKDLGEATSSAPSICRRTPRPAPGCWELRVDVARSGCLVEVQVEEFLPERMKMTLDTEQQVLSPDDELSIDVQGDYLYGAPAAGNRLWRPSRSSATVLPCRSNGPASSSATWPMTRAARSASCPNSRWTTTQGHHRSEPEHRRHAFAHEGCACRPACWNRAAVRWCVPSSAPSGPPTLIAVRPQFDGDVARENAPAVFEVVRVTSAGEAPLAQAQMRLYREERQYYWRFDDQRGWNSSYPKPRNCRIRAPSR